MEDKKYLEDTRMLLNKLKESTYEKGITEQEIFDKTGFIQSNGNRMFAGKY